MFCIQLTICLCSKTNVRCSSTGAYNNPVFSSIVIVPPELISNKNKEQATVKEKGIKNSRNNDNSIRGRVEIRKHSKVRLRIYHIIKMIIRKKTMRKPLKKYIYLNFYNVVCSIMLP